MHAAILEDNHVWNIYDDFGKDNMSTMMTCLHTIFVRNFIKSNYLDNNPLCNMSTKDRTEIRSFLFKKRRCKTSSAEIRLSYHGLNVLNRFNLIHCVGWHVFQYWLINDNAVKQVMCIHLSGIKIVRYRILMCVRASVDKMQCTLAHHTKFVRASCVNFHTLPNTKTGQVRSYLISMYSL